MAWACGTARSWPAASCCPAPASARILPLADIPLPGEHSVSNVLAAVAVGLVYGIAPEAIAARVRAFAGVEHRLEPVAEVAGVRYVNDSQGTQPDAVIAAVRSFEQPLVLIAGGRAKGNPIEELARVVAERVTAAVLIGESASELEAAFARRRPGAHRACGVDGGGGQDGDSHRTPDDAGDRAAEPGSRLLRHVPRLRGTRGRLQAGRVAPRRGGRRLMEALRFPWDDERRREVAPSAFRPRKAARRGTRDQAARPLDRRDVNRARRPSPSVSPAVTAGLARPTVRPSGHASREAARDRTSGRTVQGPQRERHEPDYMLLAIALALAAMGILMVYSSSGVKSAIDEGNVFAAVTTQLGWGLLGGLVLLVMMRVDYRYWRSFSVLGLAVAVVLLVLVLSKGYLPMVKPLELNGATRWLQIGGLPAFQPTEVAKFALVVFAAHWLTTRGAEVRSFRRGLLPFSIIVGLIAVLVVLEPDLGTTGVLVLTAYSMYFVAGGRVWQMLLLLPVALAGVAGADPAEAVHVRAHRDLP